MKNLRILDQYRLTDASLLRRMGYDWTGDETCGVFRIPSPLRPAEVLAVIASAGMGWDHVSVSLQKHVPTWTEMCYIKDLFFDAEECVVQFHPPKSDYKNYHPNCLHLWRPNDGVEFPRPASIMVAP